ncbi:hypothetical protein HY224_03025 [Candidatus Uhrbacteria bacterium]|nr:hypothetical protein [Candidatus Uhrbacteria bacterium]
MLLNKEAGVQVLALIAGLIYLAGYFPYVIGMWRGQTRPSKASWIIWAALDLITAGEMYSKDALNWQMVGAAIGSTVIIILVCRVGKPGWTRTDKICLALAGVAVLVWQGFDSPLLGLGCSLCGALIGLYPTVEAAWVKPEDENRLGWTLWFVSCVLAVVAIPQWTREDAAQPIVFLVQEVVMVYVLYVRPWRLGMVKVGRERIVHTMSD